MSAIEEKQRNSQLRSSRPKRHFENEAMEYYLSWLLGYCAHGGAEYGECMRVVSQIKDHDPHSWAAAWRRMARQVEALALATLAAGHLVSAREEYLRAAMYYRASLIFIRPKAPEFLDGWEDMRSCFRMASALFQPPITHVEVPFEDKMLPGYIMRADAGHTPRPTLIMVGGNDAFAEELYFWAAASGAARGYNILLVELPGQGSTPLSELYFRVDAEKPLQAVVDYALALPEVDPDRLYLYGVSGGGYMVARAAAHDKRIKACVLNAPITDMHDLLTAELSRMVADQQAHMYLEDPSMWLVGYSVPVTEIVLDKLCWQMGTESVSEALHRIKQARLGDLVGAIECPTLCLVSEGEPAMQNMQAREFYNALQAPKQMRTFTAEEGVEAHCEVDNLALMQATLFDWLDEL